MTLQARIASLRAEVARHNAAIRTHRKQRRDAQAELVELEAACRRLGIGFIIVPQHSEGAVHGRPATESHDAD